MLPFRPIMSTEKKSPFVKVDELMPKVSLEQAAAYYGVKLPELKRIGSETRSACFLHCGKTEPTGDRVLAIQTDHPARQWHCHKYGCHRGGNLIGLCDLMKPGGAGEGKPRGERFKSIATDLLAMASGSSPATPTEQPPSPAPLQPPKQEPAINIPLSQSDNERARALVELDLKFVLDPASMSPAASAYFRRRDYLSPEVCQTFRMGFLPRDTGGDSAGGTLRGQIIYPYLDENGELLCWFGRDPLFEQKYQEWKAGQQENDAPAKFRFVKGFHRGLEIWNQDKLKEADAQASLQRYGLILTEGPNDAMRLHTLGVAAVSLCSNAITRDQAAKVARLARQYGNGIITILLDNDPEGERGMKLALGYLAQLAPVRLAWTPSMYEGRFQNRQPESLSMEEWQLIADHLQKQAPSSGE